MVGFSRGIVDFGGIEELPGGLRCFREVFWGSVDAIAGYRGAPGRC